MLRQQVWNSVDDPEGAPAFGANQQVAAQFERGPVSIKGTREDFK